MNKESFPIHLLILVLVITALQIPGLIFSWYANIWWLDVLMHFLGGLWIGGVALWYCFSSGRVNFSQGTKNYLLVAVASVFVIGLLWEVFEIGVDKMTALHAYQYLDGFYDMIMDILGASVAALYFLKFNNQIVNYAKQKA